jgi:hypothetical protein
MRAYSIRVLAGLLRAVSVVASAVVLLSFGLFAIDETRTASQRSTAEIAGLRASRSADPNAGEERARERAHSSVRELIDDANDVLIAPFTWAAPEGSGKWAQRGIPAVVALVVYAFVLPFVARYAQGIG